jgi:hypothetical protein
MASGSEGKVKRRRGRGSSHISSPRYVFYYLTLTILNCHNVDGEGLEMQKLHKLLGMLFVFFLLY